MLKMISKPAVKLVERYLPDPYIFVLLLTLIASVAAIAIERQTPLAVLRFWGDGFWGLLTFSMQMLLVLVTGFMLASSPPVKRILQKIAGTAKSPGGAIILVTLVSLAASWINWGFGLVVGAQIGEADGDAFGRPDQGRIGFQEQALLLDRAGEAFAPGVEIRIRLGFVPVRLIIGGHADDLGRVGDG